VAEIKGVGDDAPSVKRIPPAGVLESDAKLLGELGKRYRKITANEAEAEGGGAGSFSRWRYGVRGLGTLAHLVGRRRCGTRSRTCFPCRRPTIECRDG